MLLITELVNYIGFYFDIFLLSENKTNGIEPSMKVLQKNSLSSTKLKFIHTVVKFTSYLDMCYEVIDI